MRTCPAVEWRPLDLHRAAILRPAPLAADHRLHVTSSAVESGQGGHVMASATRAAFVMSSTTRAVGRRAAGRAIIAEGGASRRPVWTDAFRPGEQSRGVETHRYIRFASCVSRPTMPRVRGRFMVATARQCDLRDRLVLHPRWGRPRTSRWWSPFDGCSRVSRPTAGHNDHELDAVQRGADMPRGSPTQTDGPARRGADPGIHERPNMDCCGPSRPAIGLFELLRSSRYG